MTALRKLRVVLVELGRKSALYMKNELTVDLRNLKLLTDLELSI